MMTAYPQIKLLGVPALTRAGQPITGFVSSKAVATVYYIAANGQTQARDVLATLLWTNSTDIYAKKNLRNVLSNLRVLLSDGIEITRETVSLPAPLLDAVDSQRFLALFKAAEQTASVAQRREYLAAAVALYQGPFLDGFHVADAEAFDEWLQGERERFGLLAIQAFNEVVAASVHEGHFLEGLNYATRLLNLDPLREESYRHLMLLLALDGQTSAALGYYRACQKMLRTELGVAPDAATEALYQRILAGEFSKKTLVIAPPTPATRPHRALPAELTSFVDREAELAQILQRLADPACRLVTLLGMGGVGKTRLALRAAHIIAGAASVAWSNPQPLLPAFPDGVAFVPLAALEPSPQIAHQLATTIADGLQIPLRGGLAPADQLQQALYDKALLLVLDNCEHLPVAPFINALLQQTRFLKILVTSRTRLNVHGEQLLQLRGLATPTAAAPSATGDPPPKPADFDTYSAMRLFTQSVQAIMTDFTLDETTAGPVAEICRLVHGLPLGIELAATWARLLPLPEIVQEIQQNLDFLDNTFLETPAHQRSLRAIFNHSWRLLSPVEQQVLRQLAVFRGGFTREAAAKVAGATLPLLAQLADKSMVQRSDSGVNGPDGPMGRYELQVVIRQYAAEQLAEAGEIEMCQQRHAAYMAEFLAARLPDLQSVRQRAALRFIHIEIENVRAAWQWLIDHLQSNEVGLAQIEQQVSQGFDSLFHFYDMRSWFQEGETVFAQLAQRLPAYPFTHIGGAQPQALWRLQAKAQARQAWFAFHLGRYTEGRTAFEQSLHNLRQVGAEAETVFNLNYLGALLRHIGDLAGAEQNLQAALTVAQNHHDDLGASIALNTLGQLAFLQGDYAQTQNRCRQALVIKQAIGDRWGMTYSLTSLGRVAQATGDYDAAQKLFTESLSICREIGDQRGAAMSLQNLADTAYRSGQPSQAQTHYRASLQIYQTIGSRAEASLLLSRLGEVACAGGEYTQAAEQLHAALSLAWAVQATPSLLAALLGLAMLAQTNGQSAQALQPLRLVYHHPASSQAQQARAAELLIQQGADLTTPPAAAELATYVQMQLIR